MEGMMDRGEMRRKSKHMRHKEDEVENWEAEWQSDGPRVEMTSSLAGLFMTPYAKNNRLRLKKRDSVLTAKK